MLFSVVTPVRNLARYLPDTLDSVAALTVPHEHVVIDGGSDDGTVELLEARQDPDLKWVSEPDRGQTDAVNKGLGRSSGELIGWLNGDDAYLPEAVDRAVGHLEANPEVMAICGGIEFTNEQGEVFRTHVPTGFNWRRALYLGTYIPTPAIIFRRSLLDRAPALDESYADAADYDFYLRLLRGVRVTAFPEPLVRFRYHPKSKSTRDVWRQHDEALEIRLKWARGPLDRAIMRGWESAKRLILPRISSWPYPHPTGAARLRAAVPKPQRSGR